MTCTQRFKYAIVKSSFYKNLRILAFCEKSLVNRYKKRNHNHFSHMQPDNKISDDYKNCASILEFIYDNITIYKFKRLHNNKYNIIHGQLLIALFCSHNVCVNHILKISAKKD